MGFFLGTLVQWRWRALSSGEERRPYKAKVGSSNLSAPTKFVPSAHQVRLFIAKNLRRLFVRAGAGVYGKRIIRVFSRRRKRAQRRRQRDHRRIVAAVGGARTM